MHLQIRHFLQFLLDDTLEDARKANLLSPDPLAFKAIKTALRECHEALASNTLPQGLTALLANARQEAAEHLETPDGWYWTVREYQITWIAEVVSVALLNQRLRPIVDPSRSAFEAAIRLIDENAGT